ncbi:hypothetical protein B0H16DRAFT_802866 [Mycena metata]|uniref:Uncharacterized protein n=1 Tax=Mycena metata TaxID=1033252 RepID=A0AAD7NXH0_9AGAR|nr:hypothetical protein B0H16DRAFT_802866 [Mycena metata]
MDSGRVPEYRPTFLVSVALILHVPGPDATLLDGEYFPEAQRLKRPRSTPSLGVYLFSKEDHRLFNATPQFIHTPALHLYGLTTAVVSLPSTTPSSSTPLSLQHI